MLNLSFSAPCREFCSKEPAAIDEEAGCKPRSCAEEIGHVVKAREDRRTQRAHVKERDGQPDPNPGSTTSGTMSCGARLLYVAFSADTSHGNCAVQAVIWTTSIPSQRSSREKSGPWLTARDQVSGLPTAPHFDPRKSDNTHEND